MLFSALTIFATLAVAPFASASVGVHCGTTDDATLSDCRNLVNPATWNGAWAGGNNLCHYTNLITGEIDAEAHNVACSGNCCVYVARVAASALDKEKTRQEAEGLLGCGDVGKNKVNALNTFADGHGVCVSNGNGCGDCFDDSDFST